jgi:proline dehydrogenase
MGVFRTALLWGSQNKWLENQFRRRRFARKAVSRFMPGEELDSALRAADDLNKRGISTILTCLGENVASPDEISAVTRDYQQTLDQVRAHGLPTQVSVKLTNLGLDVDRDGTYAHLQTLIRHAAQLNNFVWVDMEASEYVDVTLALYRRARAEFPNVGLCLQAYLYRTADDLADLLERDASIRLVKGAYREPASVAFPRKADVDRNFMELTGAMLDHTKTSTAHPHAVATHDMALIDATRSLADRKAVPQDRWEVDMLFGIRQADQLRLVEAGVPVRVLISYGEAWFAWYMRRLAERPANVGFVVKSMVSG